MIAALRRLACTWRGHDAVLRIENGRLLMRCASCGYDTPGWNIARDNDEGFTRRRTPADSPLHPYCVIRQESHP